MIRKRSIKSVYLPRLQRPEEAEIKATLGLPLTYVFRIKGSPDVEDIVKAYITDPNVEYAEPNYLLHTMAIPNDAKFPQQWGLNNIKAVQAWDIQKGSEDIVVAVIDTGVNYNHPDLALRIWQNPKEIPNEKDDDGNGFIDDMRGWDFVDEPDAAAAPGEDVADRDNDPMDRNGHGTHVAGIITAETDNKIGIAGVAPRVKIMPLRAGYTTPDGNGVLATDDAVQAILYAVGNGAKIINMSWGTYADSKTLKQAIKLAQAMDVTPVAAAGNEDTDDKLYPADYRGVIAVAAVDLNDMKAEFSNFGNHVSVSAPGVKILSTFDNDYRELSGTSMAAPFVTGLAALLLSAEPTLFPFNIKKLIENSADSINEKNPGYKGLLGRGRINAFEALRPFSSPVQKR